MTSDFNLRIRLGVFWGRRVLVGGLTMIVTVMLTGWVLARSALPAAVPRIDMKVLLLGTSTTEPDFQAWQAALKREGVPFDTLIESSTTASGSGHTSIAVTSCTGSDRCQTLSDSTGGGAPEAKYEGVIVATAGLPVCSTTCSSALAASDWSALEAYEHEFNIRQVTGAVVPGGSQVAAPGPQTNYGLNPYTQAPGLAGNLDGITGSMTNDGKRIFPYLNGTVLFGDYPANFSGTTTYGYEATPAAGANFDRLLSGPNGSALVGVYTDSRGVQQLVETYNQNQYLLQDELLQHGALSWLTRGVYFGDQRNYLETHIDDNFLSDDSWSTATHSTDFNPADALREVPADVTKAATWSAANHFRIDMLFNGGGSVAVANGSSLVGAGDSGSGGTGSTGGSPGTGSCTTTTPCPDPLLAALQATDPATGKPYTDDFGWISHTWDHPNIDEGCATQNYIEAELNQNADWGAKPASAGDPINGGLGLTESTDPSAALGNENPNVIVTGEHSGLANLLPGNPGQVDPPSLDDAIAATTGGSLAAAEYVYAVSDQFNTAAPGATPVPGTGESAGSVSAPVTVTGTTGSVTLSWTAVCHAADYKIYRAAYTPSGTTGTIGAWSLIGTVPANTTTDFTDPTGGSTVSTAGGGPIEKTFTDTGTAGTATGNSGTPSPTSTPSSQGTAIESAYEQNPALDAAFAGTIGGGIKYFGADASKPYPNPADSPFTTGAFTGAATEYPSGATFQDAGATAIPRYPTNIYYNVSTNAQEVDEYQTLYDLPTCTPVAGVTTCNPAGTVFTIDQIIAGVDQGMFQHMMDNDPRPSYFHQTNLMSQTTGTVNGEGDGLFYETLDPLLAEYNTYFASTAPIEQPTMPQIGTLLSDQAAWATASGSQVSGYIQSNQVTVINSGGGATEIPLSGTTTVGSSYGGTTSGWTSAPAGTSTYTAQITWPVDNVTMSLSPASITADGKSTSTVTATVTSQGNPVAGDAVSFASSDAGEKIGAVRDNGNGTYTATITSSTRAQLVTITASDSSVQPNASAQATLMQTPGPAARVKVALSPTSILANGTSQSTATVTVTDAQSRPIAGQHVGFTASDRGVHFGTVTDHRNGTYTGTLTSSTTPHPVTITATDSSVSPRISGKATLTQTPHPTRPSNTALPAISGSTVVGRTLSVSRGTWSGTAPVSYAYEWQRCKQRRCANIAGAKRSSYKLGPADAGTKLQVVVTATNRYGTAKAFSRQQVGPVLTAGQVTARLISGLLPRGSGARIGTLLKLGGYRFSFSSPGSAHLAISWYRPASAPVAKGKRVLVASMSVSLQGTSSIKLALTAKGRQALKRAKHLQLSAHGTLSLTGGSPIAATRSFTVTR